MSTSGSSKSQLRILRVACLPLISIGDRGDGGSNVSFGLRPPGGGRILGYEGWFGTRSGMTRLGRSRTAATLRSGDLGCDSGRT